MKWLKHFFVTVHFLLISSILLTALALYIAFRPDGLRIVNTYFLEPFGIHYSHAQGSLIDGFTLHKLQTKTFEATTLTLQYNLVKMLQGEHTIDAIKIDGLRIHLDDFMSDEDSVWPFPTFAIKMVDITNLQLISSYPIELDIHAKNGSYDGDIIAFSILDLSFKSRFGSGALHGTLQNSSFRGLGTIYPVQQQLHPHIGSYTELPEKLDLDIAELSKERVSLRTALNELSYKPDPTLKAKRIALAFNYIPKENLIDLKSTYRLTDDTHHIDIKQGLQYHTDGTLNTQFEGMITTPLILPSKRLTGEFTVRGKTLAGSLLLGTDRLTLKSADRNLFLWEFHARHSDLSFAPILPKQLAESPTQIDASGNYLLEDSILSGFIRIDHNHAKAQGSFSLSKEHREFQGTLELPPDAPTWKMWEHKPPTHLQLSLENDNNRSQLDISGENTTLKATLESDKIIARGEYLGIVFNATASLKDQTIEIDSSIPSAFATWSRIKPLNLYKNEFYDAQLEAKTHIRLSDTLDIESEISIPWYAAVFDSQNAFGGTDNRFSVRYINGNIKIERYRIDILNHPVETDRASTLHLAPEGGIIIDELWLYDTLKLTGTLDSSSNARLKIHSDRFAYNGPEGKAHASADLIYESKDTDQTLSGSFALIDGSITNLPLQQFKVMDSDIIIIQDVRPPSDKRLAMNVQITSKEPIRFKTKEFDIRFTPDFTLWKEPTAPMQILGMVTIPSGNATTTGKEFTIKHSEIYFGGDVPLNPYLNFNVSHEVDYKKINIYVTHTLDSPIFLFNSDPIMSQNDIMSYLLFGASSTDGSGGFSGNLRTDSTNFMLGAGLKGLINGITKIQIDTMNILTTPDGGMGFEVGARLNKDLRVIYKNNTVSSVLLQYNVNRWLRLDADIHELGQGINAIYIKDFRDFLPHNAKTK